MLLHGNMEYMKTMDSAFFALLLMNPLCMGLQLKSFT